MIRINQLKMPLGHDRAGLLEKAARVLRVPSGEIEKLTIVKQSVDARKKPDIWYSYVVDVGIRQAGLQKEEKLVRRLKDRNVSVHRETPYRLPEPGTQPMASRPVIIGTGPAGLFCGLMLARKGYRPILLERGEDVDARTERVARFWETGQLDPSSNVQFGEGGAGTFSDGKLNTLVKDTFGRNREVLRILTEFGGDPSILYVNKPHIGTDVLSRIVKAIRREIEHLGGEVRFLSQVTDFVTDGYAVTAGDSVTDKGQGEPGRIKALVINGSQVLETETVVLAIGHSARDTFETLLARGIPMEPKAFAVGLRVQHPQTLINESQYGMKECGELGPASYKLTWKASDERGVYSFCMCPGGYVVNASSEPGRLAVNGMSYHDRAGENANSAIIVTVTPEDFGGVEAESGMEAESGAEAESGMEAESGTQRGCQGPVDAMAGIRFQRRLEEAAFCLGKGSIPVQLYGDFKEGRVSEGFGGVNPAFRGGYAFANLRELFPEPLSRAFVEGMEGFGTMIRGFDRPDAILAGIESRTSSPVRIPRDQGMESPVRGIFPCGEGAGYAGGITSAAMDGIKTAEEIIRRYSPLRPSQGTSGEKEHLQHRN